jgi:glycosyltransferase involved in cell wall biosynthesis
MNILVANNHLSQTGGTENYTYAIIVELVKLGHQVEYFTFEKGMVSDMIENLGVKFRSKKIYDLIIANHKTTIKALNKRGFIIQTCHGKFIDLEQPSQYADTYVAISEEVNQYLHSLNKNSIIIRNGIDCERFYPKNPISDSLSCVLSLCQSDESDKFIYECCKEINVEFIKASKFFNNVWDIENLINKADLVVGIGRSLYDAMACGRAVISFDKRNYSAEFGDGYLTKDNIWQSIAYNCSGRGTKKTYTKDSFIKELKKYNKGDGEFMRNFALENLNIKNSVNQYLNILPKNKLLYIKTKKSIDFISNAIYNKIKK